MSCSFASKNRNMEEDFPMHFAASSGDAKRVRQFIEGGMSVDSPEYMGRTPLHCTAEAGSYEMAELLISSKCDLNRKDDEGRTPVLLAAKWRKRSMVDLLLRHGAQVNCAEGQFDASNVPRDAYKWTVLHYASKYGWTDIVRPILDFGEADINAATWCGETPLMVAAENKHQDVAALLIRAGADVHRSDRWGKTALHVAAIFGAPQVVQVLLGVEGLDLNPQDNWGETPLHYACSMRRREVVKQLLKAGADTTIKNNMIEAALSAGMRQLSGGMRALREGIREEESALGDIRLFVQHGGFLQDPDYALISEIPFLKENVLRDVGLCTQSILNKFHRQSLPALKRISYFARELPNTDEFKLGDRQIDEVKNLVECEIERKGYCNVVKARPMSLSALCVQSLITCQSGTKRSASPDFGGSNSPFKKLQT